ncbi:MAG: aspartate kinase, partial [Chitinophagaceae bacterium]
MKIYKFGGASVKDASGIRNVYDVLEIAGHEDVLLVVSAMGKTTNALEVVIANYFDNKKEVAASLDFVKSYHLGIISDLFQNPTHPVLGDVQRHFEDMEYFLSHNKSPNYNFVYDQIVSYGELLSTVIISHYMSFRGLNTNWIDVRNFIKTDSTYRDANVNWQQTQQNIVKNVKKKSLNITQGFLGSDENNFTTTLGREGSDYT